MSPPAAGCCHVTGFKVENWKQNLRAIYQCFVWSGSAETRKRKISFSDHVNEKETATATRGIKLVLQGSQDRA